MNAAFFTVNGYISPLVPAVLGRGCSRRATSSTGFSLCGLVFLLTGEHRLKWSEPLF